MKIAEILDILKISDNGCVALVAPNDAEAKLLLDRFRLSNLLPKSATCTTSSIKFDKYTLEFLTPKTSYGSRASYFIIEFPDMIPEPDFADVGMNAEDVLLCGEIM